MLSDSTKSYDIGDKFEAYRSIPSFQKYLLVGQYRHYVEQHVKQGDNQWLLTIYNEVSATIELSSLPITLEMSRLYGKVKFTD